MYKLLLPRINRIIITLALFICVAISCNTSISSQSDINYIYKQIIENHPGMHNKLDPFFKQHLDQARQHVIDNLQFVASADDYQALLTEFTRSFNDKHLYIAWRHTHSQASTPLTRKSCSIKTITPDRAWVTLPTFDSAAINQKLFRHLLKTIATLQHVNTLVFDLRGNTGGNSDYGTQIVNELFGKEYAQQQRAKVNQFQSIDWRASKGNLAYLQSLFDEYRHTWEPDQVIWLEEILAGLQQSIASQNPYYREQPFDGATPDSGTPITNNVTAKIIVITDAKNVSAALDFIDELKIMDYPITLIGQTTSADRLYMEVRSTPLPSNLGVLSFPIKVYRNRMRKDNEPYVPPIFCNTDDKQALERLIQKLSSE